MKTYNFLAHKQYQEIKGNIHCDSLVSCGSLWVDGNIICEDIASQGFIVCTGNILCTGEAIVNGNFVADKFIHVEGNIACTGNITTKILFCLKTVTCEGDVFFQRGNIGISLDAKNLSFTHELRVPKLTVHVKMDAIGKLTCKEYDLAVIRKHRKTPENSID